MALKKYVQPSKTLSVSSLQTRDGNDDAHLFSVTSHRQVGDSDSVSI